MAIVGSCIQYLMHLHLTSSKLDCNKVVYSADWGLAIRHWHVIEILHWRGKGSRLTEGKHEYFS